MYRTVKIGKPAESGTYDDNDYRVIGMKGLRVVDMSVAPFMPRWEYSYAIPFDLGSTNGVESAHPQAVAYVIGVTAAEKIIAKYERH